jgi:hypothetical protein
MPRPQASTSPATTRSAWAPFPAPADPCNSPATRNHVLPPGMNRALAGGWKGASFSHRLAPDFPFKSDLYPNMFCDVHKNFATRPDSPEPGFLYSSLYLFAYMLHFLSSKRAILDASGLSLIYESFSAIFYCIGRNFHPE